MTLADYIAIAVILLIVGGAALYIIRAKKKGTACIGCPDAKTCPHAKNGKCGNCSNK